MASESTTAADASSHIPEPIKAYLAQFQKALNTAVERQSVDDLLPLYEHKFQKLSEKYYKEEAWPVAEDIATVVNNDKAFLNLYNELIFRHTYSKHPAKATTQFRIQSFYNYTALFDYILKTDNLPFDLPNQWLWDMVDEFIYQFDNFSQIRMRAFKSSKPKDRDVEILKQNQTAWSASTVLSYLEQLIAKSEVNKLLQELQNNAETNNASLDQLQFQYLLRPGPQNTKHVLRMLGYFSLIGLARVQCLLADYQGALNAVANIDIFGNKKMFTSILGCFSTIYYYVGFSYLMMRRYVDSCKCFTTLLGYLARNKLIQNNPSQYELILKRGEKCYGLLAIAISLYPQRVEEVIHLQLREKFGEKINRMQRGDEATFEETMKYCCPKFILPFIPSHDDTNKESIPAPFIKNPVKYQLRLFLNEVKQQQQCSTVRSYLKLYTTVPISKLSKFLDVDDSAFATQLLCIKHKARQLVNTSTDKSPLSGTWQQCSDVDFYVEKEMVHVADTKTQKNYSEYFVRQIAKLQDLKLEVPKVKK